jgi:hypothetical protein
MERKSHQYEARRPILGHNGRMQEVEVERDGQWWPGTMGLWREDERGWVATVRYAAGGRQYTETMPADRVRTLPNE